MSTILPVNLDDLLHQRSVESARVEFKASWNKQPTGKQVLKTVCAFANDHQNLNGGYVVLGVAEQGGQAVLPPVGLRAEDIERAQKFLRGQCRAYEPTLRSHIFARIGGRPAHSCRMGIGERKPAAPGTGPGRKMEILDTDGSRDR